MNKELKHLSIFLKADAFDKYINMYSSINSSDECISFTYKNFYKIIKKTNSKIILSKHYSHEKYYISVKIIFPKDKYEYVNKLVNKYCYKFPKYTNHFIHKIKDEHIIYWKVFIRYRGIPYKLKSLSNIFSPSLNKYISNTFKTYNNKFFIYFDKETLEEKYISYNNFYNLIKGIKSKLKLYERVNNNIKNVLIIFYINKKQYESKYELINKYCYVCRRGEDLFCCFIQFKIGK